MFIEPLAAAFEIKEQVKLDPQWNVAVIGDGRLAQLIARVLKLSCNNITCFGRHKNKLRYHSTERNRLPNGRTCPQDRTSFVF